MCSNQVPLIITPDTKIGDLLERYPKLEDVLIGLSPTYKALKNPVLRRTVAKVATLHQVSKVGNVPIGSLIDTLRSAVGQETGHVYEEGAAVNEARPAWARAEAVVRTFDARALIQAGSHPMPQVMSDLNALKPGEVYALVTPFVPAPLIDLASQKGFAAWSGREESDTVRTYFTRASGS
jgi:uncharacterized protein (DUF2249 family)